MWVGEGRRGEREERRFDQDLEREREKRDLDGLVDLRATTTFDCLLAGDKDSLLSDLLPAGDRENLRGDFDDLRAGDFEDLRVGDLDDLLRGGVYERLGDFDDLLKGGV